MNRDIDILTMTNSVPKRTILAVVALTTFLVTFMGSSVNIALPAISSDIQIDAVMVNWISTAYLLATATCLLPFGRLADIYGRKRILTLGVMVFTIASLGIVFVSSAGAIVALRVVQGVGSAMIATTGVAIITAVFKEGERGQALGISITGTYLGLSLGPVLGGLLIQNLGWRSIFWIIVPIGIVAIALIARKIRGEWAEATGKKFDLFGTAIYGLSLVGIIYGFSVLPGTTGTILVVSGVLGILAFFRWEGRVTSPILDINTLFKNRMFVLSNIIHLISYTTTFSVAFLLSLYLQYIKGLGPRDAGLVLVTMAAVQAGFAAFAGKLSDRYDARVLGTAGLILATIGLSRLIFLSDDTGINMIVLYLVMLGFGRSLFITSNTHAIMSSVSRIQYGVASATLATMRQIGMTFSMGITMLLFSIYIGRVEITPQYYPVFMESARTAFLIFTCICAIAIPFSVIRGKN